MILRKHFLFALALLSIMLIGQIAVLSHSVEHPFHADEESCQIFLQCQKSADGIVSTDIQLIDFSRHDAHIVSSLIRSLPSLKSAYLARAPPFVL